MGEVLVELGVFLRLDVLLRALPERNHSVERTRLVLLTTLLVLVLLVGGNVDLAECNRIRDEIGIFLHELGDAPPVEVFGLIVAKVQHDAGAEAVAL